MRLALSTAAAADFTLDELVAACARRGLAGLELVAGHAHGVSTTLVPTELEAVRRRAEAGGPQIVAFRATPACALCSDAARLSFVLGAPVVARLGGDDRVSDSALISAAAVYALVGATLLIAHGSDPDAVWRLRRLSEFAPEGALGLAWDADPSAEELAPEIPAVLEAAGPYLRHIRLLGSGPEAARHEGCGIGPLMARLALGRYDGALALAPSTARYHVAWNAWLGRGGGWGCGGRTADPSLVQLNIPVV